MHSNYWTQRELPKKRGALVAIEGIDQSGKRTQARLLASRLRSIGYSCKVLNFPDYTTPLGRQLRSYLAGRVRFDFHAVHLLYAANKWERTSEIIHDIHRGRNVIVNRYSPSNMAYGLAHGLPLDWLVMTEQFLPKADVVLVLDVSPRTSFSRKKRLRDVHEGNIGYLSKVRRAYLRLARLNRWKVIDGERHAHIVHLELWRHVSRIFRGRLKQ